MLAVVAFHAGHWIPGGFLGVDVFFVISGYVIVAMLLREAERSGRVSLPSFYARRVRRLLPALALMLATVVVASAFLQSPIGTLGGQDLTARTAIGALLIGANAVLYQVPIDGYFADVPSTILCCTRGRCRSRSSSTSWCRPWWRCARGGAGIVRSVCIARSHSSCWQCWQRRSRSVW